MIGLFLSADFGTPISAEYNKPSLKDLINDTLDTPVNGSSNSSLMVNITNVSSNNNTINNNVVINRILKYNPNATIGEVLAVNMMFEEQLNNSKTDLDLSLYYDYLNNSSTYPIIGVDLTARELYDQAQGVYDFIDGLDNILIQLYLEAVQQS
jgi:hypothetical protein